MVRRAQQDDGGAAELRIEMIRERKVLSPCVRYHPPSTAMRLQHLLLAASMPLRCSRRSIVSMRAEEFPLITSSTNPRLKLIKRLQAKKHREREGLVLLVRALSPRQPAQ